MDTDTFMSLKNQPCNWFHRLNKWGIGLEIFICQYQTFLADISNSFLQVWELTERARLQIYCRQLQFVLESSLIVTIMSVFQRMRLWLHFSELSLYIYVFYFLNWDSSPTSWLNKHWTLSSGFITWIQVVGSVCNSKMLDICHCELCFL